MRRRKREQRLRRREDTATASEEMRRRKRGCDGEKRCDGERETATARRDCDGERLRRRARVSTMAAGARDHVRRQGAVTSEWAERAGWSGVPGEGSPSAGLGGAPGPRCRRGLTPWWGESSLWGGGFPVGRFGSLPARSVAVAKPVHGASLFWPSVSANTFFSRPAC